MELEEEIAKRDELIYSMMRNTHNYQNFMNDERIDIEELRKRFKTEEVIKSTVAKKKIEILKNTYRK